MQVVAKTTEPNDFRINTKKIINVAWTDQIQPQGKFK